MKTTALLLGLSIVLMVACKKDKGETDNGNNKKLTDIVPQAYLDEAVAMGFKLYTGDNPPHVAGDYLLAPWRTDNSNNTSDHINNNTSSAIGYVSEKGFTLNVAYADNGGGLFVGFTGYFQGESEQTAPFIIGSGNNFTICRHRYGMGGSGGNSSFPYVFLISGTVDGNVLRNVQMASIRLKSTSPAAVDEQVGLITIYSDTDGVSPLQ